MIGKTNESNPYKLVHLDSRRWLFYVIVSYFKWIKSILNDDESGREMKEKLIKESASKMRNHEIESDSIVSFIHHTNQNLFFRAFASRPFLFFWEVLLTKSNILLSKGWNTGGKWSESRRVALLMSSVLSNVSPDCL